MLLQIIAYNLQEEHCMLNHAAKKAAGIKKDSDRSSAIHDSAGQSAAEANPMAQTIAKKGSAPFGTS